MEIISNIVANTTNIMKGLGTSDIFNYSTLFSGEQKYVIPRFQRDYSWDKENWDELWQDIMSIMHNEEVEHYMGYLVLLSGDKKRYVIIDGQQRLVTISIIILAVISKLKLVINEPDVKRKIEKMMMFISGDTLLEQSILNKLELNRNNSITYKKIVNGDELQKRGAKLTNKLMADCYKWYCEQINDLNYNSIELAKLVNTFTHQLFFTTINVTDDINAYKVFETLNARGVKLSSSDLLKNYIFQTLTSPKLGYDPQYPEEVLKDAEEKWDYITDKLNNNDFQDYLRYYWNSKHKTIRKANLFKSIKADIDSAQKAMDLLKDLEKNVDNYCALLNPYDDEWKGRNEVIEYLDMLKSNNFKQPFSLLLTAKEKLTAKDFEKILKYCVVVSFRFNIICGFNPNIQESVYNDIAVKISEDKAWKVEDFISIYPSDDIFLSHFCAKDYTGTRDMRIVRYILKPIEVARDDAKPLDLKSKKLTVEHVLPINMGGNWRFTKEEHEEWVNKIANLTFLSPTDQRKSENKSYDTKKVVFQSSKYEITKKIAADFTDWNVDALKVRHEQIAKSVKAIWSIPNL